MEATPLVSIYVVTYNSSEFILDTLESIKAQTYSNLELIISDDCSKDDTVTMCQAWINKNAEHFIHAKLICSPFNRGVCGNVNQAVQETHGTWIKGIAGDDLLMPNAIEEYVKFVTEKKCKICVAKMSFFGEDEELMKDKRNSFESNCYSFLQLDQKKQLTKSLTSFLAPGPGKFLKRELWDEIGGYDERFPFEEEISFAYNVLSRGYKFYFLDQYLVLYRVRKNSLSYDIKNWNDHVRYFKEVRRFNMVKHGLILYAIHESIFIMNKNWGIKYNNKFISLLGKGLYIFSPIAYYKLLQKFILLIKN